MTGYTLVGVNGQDEGNNLGFGAYLNFTGAGVTASISGDVITVNIPGGGGGGTPSLPFNSVQFNNAGAFGGSANFTWNGTGLVVTDGAGTTDTLSPGSLLFTTAGTGTISVKTGGGADGPLNLDILDFQINGSSGVLGQVLTSAGPGASPTWSPIPAASGWVDGGTTVYLSTSTDVVSIGNNAGVTNRKLSVYNTGTDLGISVVSTGANNNVIETFVSGEANLRWSVNANGATLWGAGGASALDTRVYRSAASTLTLDNGAAGAATFVPGADSLGAIGTASLRWSSVTANGFLVYGAAGAANAVTTLGNQALRMGPGGGVALDVRLARTTGSTLTVDDNAGGSAVLRVLGRTETQARAVGVTTQTGAYAVASTIEVVLANPSGGAFDVTLPNANLVIGRQITVKRSNTSANTVTVKSAGGTIDGVAAATGIVLAGGGYASITVVSDGTNWWII